MTITTGKAVHDRFRNKIPYKSSTKLTCGRACGNKLAARNREMKRKNEQI